TDHEQLRNRALYFTQRHNQLRAMRTSRRVPDRFPIAPPIEPMLAKLAEALPEAGAFLFEPKWDGFRAIVFRSASDVYIQSRDLKPLDRYFPELHDSLLEQLPKGSVIDGEIAKATALTYQPGRRAMIKLKHARTADCVVAGFRWHKTGKDAVGSLLLGLYDDSRTLQHVGVTSSFTMAMRKQLVKELAPL